MEAASLLRHGHGLSSLLHIPLAKSVPGFKRREPGPPSLNVGVSKDEAPSLTPLLQSSSSLSFCLEFGSQNHCPGPNFPCRLSWLDTHGGVFFN